MPDKLPQAPPFKMEWRGSLGELLLLLDHDTLRYFACVGPVESLGDGHHVVELAPQHGASQEMIENYFGKKKRPQTRRRRTSRAASEPRKEPVRAENQRVPKVSDKEQERRIREQAKADLILVKDRLNIFPAGSDERPCFNVRHGVRCEGTLMLIEVRSVACAVPIYMWDCPICGDSVDGVVLKNRGVIIGTYEKITRARKKRAISFVDI